MRVSKAYRMFERLTSENKLPVANILVLRREEIVSSLIAERDDHEKSRLQGKAEEVDALLIALDVPR